MLEGGHKVFFMTFADSFRVMVCRSDQWPQSYLVLSLGQGIDIA